MTSTKKQIDWLKKLGCEVLRMKRNNKPIRIWLAYNPDNIMSTKFLCNSKDLKALADKLEKRK